MLCEVVIVTISFLADSKIEVTLARAYSALLMTTVSPMGTPLLQFLNAPRSIHTPCHICTKNAFKNRDEHFIVNPQAFVFEVEHGGFIAKGA
jgi:hypothetical protein